MLCAAPILNGYLPGDLRKTHLGGPLALGLKREWEFTPTQKRVGTSQAEERARARAEDLKELGMPGEEGTI